MGLKEGRFIKSVMLLYGWGRKYSPFAFFTGGFTWDSLTLQRIDNLTDNLILLSYLAALFCLIVLMNFTNREVIVLPLLKRLGVLYPLGIQFFLGGLLSAYVVYYFHSASMSQGWVFLIMLGLLLLANEFLKNRLNNIVLQIGLFFLVSSSFFVFFIPMLTKTLTFSTFMAGASVALLLCGAMIALFHVKQVFLSPRQMYITLGVVVTLFTMLNVFYLSNWIPPVPLSVKQSGIYHSVKREGNAYVLQYEKPKWYQFLKKSDGPFHFAEGDRIYCFVSVFAPTALKQEVFHIWQRYSMQDKSWITTDRLSYPINGGRDGGYRGYTYKRNVQPGLWRVRVVTADDRILGHLPFRVVEALKQVKLVEERYL